ncbi:AraC family transcriptional regulator [Trinickia dinghuensis]|uniref:AraC family transcriptional regulator n=1 Tax=Trinickia dinghuensis TaxID=2291023 RepID=A0A3D8JS35_9BURK|nr:helix-turn-helix transcriptional regulator [Trinickia dinghuensis]RDU95929.1 AraC family transcriptional regulator [Trinickia dinghuensis]
MLNLPVEAVAIDHAAGVEIAGHAHGSGQLSLVSRGTMTITAEEGWWLAPPGLAVWIPPNVFHAAHYSEASSLVNLRFASSFASRLPKGCRSIVVSDLLRELAREAVRLSAADHESELHTLGLIAELMVVQAQQPQRGPGLFVPHGGDRRLRQAIDILRLDPGNDINLDDLAARVHTSSRTLARLFTAETKMTFGRWREHLRIVCAVDKLTRGQSITQTALDLGYGSASSFTTLFTRQLGMPPRRYMEQLRRRQEVLNDRVNTNGH